MKITEKIFKEAQPITNYSDDDFLYISELVTENYLNNNHIKYKLYDHNYEELISKFINEEYIIYMIPNTSLLFDAIGWLYDTYHSKNICKINEKLATDTYGNLYFFTNHQEKPFEYLFQHLEDNTHSGDEVFLRKINQ